MSITRDQNEITQLLLITITAAQQEKPRLNEKLYLECFAIKTPARNQTNAMGGARG